MAQSSVEALQPPAPLTIITRAIGHRIVGNADGLLLEDRRGFAARGRRRACKCKDFGLRIFCELDQARPRCH